MKLEIVWKTNGKQIETRELLRELRFALYNGCDLRAKRVQVGACAPDEQSIVFEIDELYKHLFDSILCHIRKTYGVQPTATVTMSLEESAEIENLLCLQRRVINEGIRMLRETRNWFKDKRLAAIRQKLVEGIYSTCRYDRYPPEPM
jgi:hypothetical protein